MAGDLRPSLRVSKYSNPLQSATATLLPQRLVQLSFAPPSDHHWMHATRTIMKLSSSKAPLLLLLLVSVVVIASAQEPPAPSPTMESVSTAAVPGFCVLVLTTMASLFAAFAR
ncbi:hypothetical protein BHM03_00038035 [Ensete ventricosum]|nr:hypothetical protein BHM03_00038035 [Ensete ventricosum]